MSDPLVYALNGGFFAGELVYWGGCFRVSGNASGFVVLEGFADGCYRRVRREYVDWREGQRPGIRTLDLMTNKMGTLLNNYFGYYFSTADDPVMDAKGDV